MTPLARILGTRIKLGGPITIAEYMAEALGHPEHGYYRRRDPLGAAGDFTTAPEIGQAFGELLGLWCADCWDRMGRPRPVRLVELGPGRGTLMADALRAATVMPGFRQAIDLHLVETSPTLRARQLEALGDAAWHDRFETVPAGPMLLIANEFFDALPVHQFQATAAGWRERLVALEAGGEGFRPALASAPSPAAALISPTLDPAGLPPGSVVEVAPAGIALAAAIGARLTADGGAAVIIDYGHAASAAGDTLQAVRGHRRHPVLAEPGAADLTAHVDFAALGRAAARSGARVHGPVTQGAFLRALGIEARTAALKAEATAGQAEAIVTGGRRLIDEAEMGNLFKVLALCAPDLPPPDGFAAGRSPK